VRCRLRSRHGSGRHGYLDPRQVVEVVTEPTGRQHIGPPKTRAARRTVGLPHFVVEALAERMNSAGAPEDFVFVGAKGGLLRVSIFRSGFWRPAVNAAGLEGLRIHDLRHTAVALWIAAGANQRRSQLGPGTLRSASRLTATATSTLRPTSRYGSDWRPSMRPAATHRGRPRPQRGPRQRHLAASATSPTSSMTLTCTITRWA